MVNNYEMFHCTKTRKCRDDHNSTSIISSSSSKTVSNYKKTLTILHNELERKVEKLKHMKLEVIKPTIRKCVIEQIEMCNVVYLSGFILNIAL